MTWLGEIRAAFTRVQRGQAHLPDPEVFLSRLLKNCIAVFRVDVRSAQGQEGGLAPALCFKPSSANDNPC